MLRVVARTLHFFLPVLQRMNNWAWAHLWTLNKCGGVFFGPNTPIVLRPIIGEELCRRKRDRVGETYRVKQHRKPGTWLISELQFKSAATYFLLRAITPAPKNYN